MDIESVSYGLTVAYVGWNELCALNKSHPCLLEAAFLHGFALMVFGSVDPYGFARFRPATFTFEVFS